MYKSFSDFSFRHFGLVGSEWAMVAMACLFPFFFMDAPVSHVLVLGLVVVMTLFFVQKMMALGDAKKPSECLYGTHGQ